MFLLPFLSSFLSNREMGGWKEDEKKEKLKPRSETQQNISQLYQYL